MRWPLAALALAVRDASYDTISTHSRTSIHTLCGMIQPPVGDRRQLLASF